MTIANIKRALISSMMMLSLVATPVLAGNHGAVKKDGAFKASANGNKHGKMFFGAGFGAGMGAKFGFGRNLKWNDPGNACILQADDKLSDAKESARQTYLAAHNTAWNAYKTARTNAWSAYNTAVTATSTNAGKEAAWNTLTEARKTAFTNLANARKAAWDAKMTAVKAALTTHKNEVEACKKS